MSAPLVWIFFPLLLAGILMFINNQKAITLIACLFTLFLTLAAWLVPIDATFTIRGVTIKLFPTFSILGRSLTITSADRSFLALIYGSAFFWFFPSISLHIRRRWIPFGLAFISLLVASKSVEPKLYAAPILEMAVLLSIPMLSTTRDKPPKGVLRYLITQTLAVPLILFSGWLLAGINANPGNLTLVQQAATFLSVGFALLLPIFPFYSWIPMLAEETNPYVAGFLFWMLPTATLFLGLEFIDQYAWLRDATILPIATSVAGLLMVVTGGILSAFQRNLGRIMGYAVIIETGISLLALNLGNQAEVGLFLLLLVPCALSLCIWSLTLSILKQNVSGLNFKEIMGLGRVWPFATTGLVLSNLALAGLPLLASFPTYQVIWGSIAHRSLPMAFWTLIGFLGLFFSGIRALAILMSSPDGSNWAIRETIAQRLLITIGVLGLVLLGLFPQWVMPVWTKLPALFGQLAQ